MIGKFDWTQEGAVEDLKLQWAQGMTCNDIASAMISRFGGDLTKNSVIGKVTRLRLPLRGPKRCPIQTEEPHEPLRELCADDTPLEQRKQLLDLKEGDCRWPYGDVGKPDFFFCGGEIVPQHSYCIFHCWMAYANPYRRAAK